MVKRLNNNLNQATLIVRPTADSADTRYPVKDLDISKIRPNPNQPRDDTATRDEELAELTADVAINGVEQSIIVRPLLTLDEGVEYEIVAGERRWWASLAAK